MQIPLLAGRNFTAADKTGAPPVVIVNQALAKKFWPNGDAIGHRLNFGNPKKDPWVTIVGIVGNVRHASLDNEPKPEVYIPLGQAVERTYIMVLRSERDFPSLAAAVRREVQAIDSGVAIARVRSMDEVVGDSIAARRLSVSLLSVFALVAMILASVGIYGVISFLVIQRTHEMGVRMALGAQRRDVLALVLSRAAKLVGAGTAIGLLLALFGTRSLAALLYRVNTFDAACNCYRRARSDWSRGQLFSCSPRHPCRSDDCT
jgi:putative ABC transport system permease protein